MNQVVITKKEVDSYFVSDTFRPTQKYPEYPFTEYDMGTNIIYDMVRESFQTMGLDILNFNTPDWNPLGCYIKPGDTVLLKPNLVMDNNPSGGGTDCLYTQPSVVAAVIDYVYIALKGKGKIVVGDAPMQECNFEKLLSQSGYDRLINYYKKKCVEGGIEFDFVDFRGVKSIVKDGIRYYEEVDSKSTIVDLGQESEFFSLSPEQYNSMRITNYDPSILKQHHNSGKNEYCISNYLLEADVVINMPKPKTHRKAGVTISLKNIVGINSRKEFLPHHTNGSVSEGGDEYLSRSILKRIRAHFLDKRNYYSQTEKNYKGVRLYNRLLSGIALLQRFSKADSYYEGSWYGNKTISKTIIDLNKILFYADKNGKMMEIPQRKYFIVADMIVSGEKEGPVEPSPKNVGIIAVGDNPVHFDEVIGTLMGINGDIFETLKCVKNSRGKYNLLFGEEHIIKSNSNQYNEKCISEICLDDYLYFAPAKGWIEAFTVKE